MRRSGKKNPPSTPARVMPPRPAPAGPVRSPLEPAAKRAGIRVSRTTTDEPGRDLHPTRIWPD